LIDAGVDFVFILAEFAVRPYSILAEFWSILETFWFSNFDSIFVSLSIHFGFI